MALITPDHTELAYSLTEYYFGENVASVLKTLFHYDQASLKLLKYNLPHIKLIDLKRSLLLLVKYQLVDYILTVKNNNHVCEYSVAPNRVYSFYRMPKYIHQLGNREGLTASVILDALAERCLITKHKLSAICNTKLKQLNVTQMEGDVFNQEIETVLASLISEGYVVHHKDVSLNIERFNREARDNLVVTTISDYYNHERKKIQALARVILNLTRENTTEDAAVSAPLPFMSILQRVVPNEFDNAQLLERYLTKLTTQENHRFFVSCGKHDNKGQMYAIDIGLVLDHLVKEHLSSMITTRFGPKCCRVFRVLLQRGPLLLKQIEEIIMLPARDVREYSYMLIKEGLIRNRQVPKTPDNAPGKSVFIMSVELEQNVYKAADLCARTMHNLLMRYKFELKKNRPLLERSKAVQELLSSNGSSNETNLEDWNEYFNSHELAELHKINQTLDRILIARSQVDETLFLLHSWLIVRPNLGN